MSSLWSRPEGWLVLAALASPLLIVTAAADPVTVPKLTWMLVATTLLLAVLVARAGTSGRVALPRGPAAYAAYAFAAVLLLLTALAPNRGVAAWGSYGRNTGLLLYLACLLLFLVSSRLDRETFPQLVLALVLIAAPVVVYGVFQWLKQDPVEWALDPGTIIGTLGNTNFFAGYVAVTIPLAVWLALNASTALVVRIGAGALALVGFALAVESRSAQGPLAALAGLAVLAAAMLLGQRQAVRRAGLMVLAIGAAAGVASAAAVVATGRGPGATSLQPRRWFWEGALGIFADHPVTGVGIGRFADYFREHRPLAMTRELAVSNPVDAAHSVPLNFFAEGGLLLGLTHLAFVGVVGWALIRGLARLQGADRLLLGGIGGAWTAYQAQSLVSIEQPPITALHWVLAGAIVALTTPLGTWSRQVVPRRTARGMPWLVGVNSALALATIAALVVLAAPMRADLASGDAGDLEASGEIGLAADAAKDAVDLAPWQGEYWFDRAQLLHAAEDPAGALLAFDEAIARDDRSWKFIGRAAQVNRREGEVARATGLYRRLVQIDPTAPPALAEAGTHLLAQGEAETALELLEKATSLVPSLAEEHPEWWKALGDARAGTGDTSGARAAYEHALLLKPDLTSAQEALDELERTGTDG